MFKKSVVVGVSLTPERGLEVAQIDYATKTVLKYGSKPTEYNPVTQEIGDIDLFKDDLQELLKEELAIPTGSEIVLNMPTIEFKVSDYPAILDEIQVSNAIEEELYEIEKFKSYEPCYSVVMLPNSSMQFKKVAYSALVKPTIIEIAMYIKSLGYKLKAVDTSVSSVLNSLVYLERVDTNPDTTWVLMTIENNRLQIISMLGKVYLDVFNEKIAISDVLSDAENYSTVLNAAEPILKNLPAKYLCIVSKTDVISAEIIADKINYGAQIVFQEANHFLKEPLMYTSSLVDPDIAKNMTLDVIGAAIYFSYYPYTAIHFNLFNKTLGDIYLNELPPSIQIGDTKIVLSNDKLILSFIIYAIIVLLIAGGILGWLLTDINQLTAKRDSIQNQIEEIDRFLKKHENISQASFDEGDEIKIGLINNKNIYSYYTVVGTEIPQKLWLTYLKLGDKTTIEGQADNLESVYAFFRNIKDYNPNSDIKLQKLGLASSSNGLSSLNSKGSFDMDSMLTSLNADYYEFRISNDTEIVQKAKQAVKNNVKTNSSSNNNNNSVPLEPIR